MLTREQILAAKPKTRTVNIPELGGEITIRGLTAHERDRYEIAIYSLDSAAKDQHRGMLLALSIVDANGNRMFGDDDAVALGNLPAAVVNRAFGVAQRLSGLTASDLDELKKPSA